MMAFQGEPNRHLKQWKVFLAARNTEIIVPLLSSSVIVVHSVGICKLAGYNVGSAVMTSVH